MRDWAALLGKSPDDVAADDVAVFDLQKENARKALESLSISAPSSSLDLGVRLPLLLPQPLLSSAARMPLPGATSARAVSSRLAIGKASRSKRPLG